MEKIEGVIMNSDKKPEYVEDLRKYHSFKPGAGEYLVRMLYAPVNPSDYYFMTNLYPLFKPVNAIAGFEGTGKVVEVGEGGDQSMVGKVVNILLASETQYGTYATYTVVPKAMALVVENPDEDYFKRNPFVLNPLTAIGLKSIIDNSGSKSFVQTGASSNVGELLTFLARKEHNSIQIIRSEKHRERLKSLGATEILNQESPEFDQQLKEVMKKYQPGVCIDCVAGPMTGKLFNLLPFNGQLVVYGLLSLEPCSGIDPSSLIFSNRIIRGFHLFEHMLKFKPPSTFKAELDKVNKEFNAHPNGFEELNVGDIDKMMSTFNQRTRKFVFKL